MSYTGIAAEVQRLPLHEQLYLMEVLAHAIQKQVALGPEPRKAVAPMSSLRGVLW